MGSCRIGKKVQLVTLLRVIRQNYLDYQVAKEQKMNYGSLFEKKS